MSVLPAVGLLAACDDPRLLGFPLWPRQREILAAVEAGPARTHVLCLGRRSGKSTMAALLGIHHCVFRPDLAAKVRPGERRYVLCVATALDHARILKRAALSVAEASSLVRELIVRDSDDEIEFRGGAILRALPCTSRSTRGLPASLIVLDEFDHHVPDEHEGPASASRLLQALIPSTTQYGRDGRVVLLSTPAGGEGTPFSDLYQRAQSGELPDARAYHFSSAQVNPTLDQTFLAAEELRDPSTFEVEYLAKFGSGSSAFFEPDDITACVAGRGELPPEVGLGGSWTAAFDPSFQRDPAALVIVGRDAVEKGRLLVGLARTWQPKKRQAVSLEERHEVATEILDGVGEACRRFGVHRIICDQYMAAGVADRLRRHGLSVTTFALTQTSKRECFLELRSRVQSRTIELPNDPALLRDLRMVRTKYSAGASTVVTPRTAESHADLAVALAMACRELRHGGGTVLPRAGDAYGPFADRDKPLPEPPKDGSYGRSGPAPAGLRWEPKGRQTRRGLLGKVF